MILPPRVSLALGRCIPRAAIDFPFELSMAIGGLLATVPILADLVVPSLIMLILPWPASVIWCVIIALASVSLLLALRGKDAQMISASLWLESLCALAYVLMFLDMLATVGWLIIAVGFSVSVMGITRSVYWGSLARLLAT